MRAGRCPHLQPPAAVVHGEGEGEEGQHCCSAVSRRASRPRSAPGPSSSRRPPSSGARVRTSSRAACQSEAAGDCRPGCSGPARRRVRLGVPVKGRRCIQPGAPRDERVDLPDVANTAVRPADTSGRRRTSPALRQRWRASVPWQPERIDRCPRVNAPRAPRSRGLPPGRASRLPVRCPPVRPERRRDPEQGPRPRPTRSRSPSAQEFARRTVQRWESRSAAPTGPAAPRSGRTIDLAGPEPLAVGRGTPHRVDREGDVADGNAVPHGGRDGRGQG